MREHRSLPPNQIYSVIPDQVCFTPGVPQGKLSLPAKQLSEPGWCSCCLSIISSCLCSSPRQKHRSQLCEVHHFSRSIKSWVVKRSSPERPEGFGGGSTFTLEVSRVLQEKNRLQTYIRHGKMLLPDAHEDTYCSRTGVSSVSRSRSNASIVLY